MVTGLSKLRYWSGRTIEIKIWKILAALIIVPILLMWYGVVHQNDEILALIRNDVVIKPDGQRMWAGTFVNTNETMLRDVVVTVNFLDSQDQAVGRVTAETAELPFNMRLDLNAPLPPNAARLRIYSVQWRMGGTAALMGPFREPWEFGYLMLDPAKIGSRPAIP